MLRSSSHASAISTSALLFSNQFLTVPPSRGAVAAGRIPDDEAAEPGWYGATIVHMRPRARDFIMHFDDDMVDGLKLPQDSDQTATPSGSSAIAGGGPFRVERSPHSRAFPTAAVTQQAPAALRRPLAAPAGG